MRAREHLNGAESLALAAGDAAEHAVPDVGVLGAREAEEAHQRVHAAGAVERRTRQVGEVRGRDALELGRVTWCGHGAEGGVRARLDAGLRGGVLKRGACAHLCVLMRWVVRMRCGEWLEGARGAGCM